MRHVLITALALLAAACSGEGPGPSPVPAARLVTYLDEACAASGRESPEDQAWLASALAGWRMLESDVFKLAAPQQSPNFVLFDAACVYRSGDGREWTAALHQNAVALPGGETVEPGVASFSSSDADGRPFMVMALPSVWREAGVPDRGDMNAFLTAIFVHEMAHTRQAAELGARIDRVIPPGLTDEVSDDMVQHRFGDNPEFTAAIAAEIADLRAGSAADEAAARQAAGKVLASIHARQALWYGGIEWLGEAADVFLAMEGAGQYASYLWLTHEQGGKRTPDQAYEMLKTRWWTQEEGLALMILVARLVPDWRERVFGQSPQTATELLAAAGNDRRSAPDR